MTTTRIYELNGEPVDLDGFIADNDLDAEECLCIRTLRPGEAFHGGGGAWAEWTLRRVQTEVITTVLLDDEVDNEAWWAEAARNLASAPSWAEDFLCSRQEQLELVDSEVAELRAWIATFYADTAAGLPIIFSEPIDTEPGSRVAIEGPPDINPNHELEGWSVLKRTNNTEWSANRDGLTLHGQSFEDLVRAVYDNNRGR
jgi:hypothetical protein